MPRFQIKRKTREPEPEVVPEEKVDETEVSYETDSESSEESEPLEEQFEALRMAERARRDTQRQTEPEYKPERSVRDATPAHRYTTPAGNPNYNQRQAPAARRMYEAPRRIDYPKPSVSRNGRPTLQYRSRYGPNSKQMTTQDKARQLYYSCFG